MEQQGAYLSLTILCADDLKRHWLSGEKTVAVVWVDSSSKTTTKVASGGGTKAEWHEKLTLSLKGADALAQGKRLTFEIHSRGKWGNSLLGTVYVPLVDLPLDGQKGANTILTYQIVLPSGKRDGTLNFMAKVVKPMMSGSVVPSPSASPAIPSPDNRLGSGLNTLYPPTDVTYPSAKVHDEAPSCTHLLYPQFESSPYSPHQSHLSQNHAPKKDAWQHAISPYPPHGMVSHPPQVYPPVSTADPPYAPSAPPYPSHEMVSHSPQVFPSVNKANPPYTPPAPCPPHSNYSGTASYSPLAWQSSAAPYPPRTSVYPPPASPFSVAPHSPTSFYPPIALHSSEATYPPASLYPYPAYPLYPPPYTPQCAPAHCCSPYPIH